MLHAYGFLCVLRRLEKNCKLFGFSTAVFTAEFGLPEYLFLCERLEEVFATRIALRGVFLGGGGIFCLFLETDVFKLQIVVNRVAVRNAFKN